MIIRPIIATQRITYYPQSYISYCISQGDVEPTEEGFLKFIQYYLKLDFAKVPDVEFLDLPEGDG